MNTKLSEVHNAKWLMLYAMIAALALVFLDQTVVPVALPVITRELSMNEIVSQWVLNGYLLTIAVLIIPAGKLADNYGHKRFFVLGLIIFFLASCVCAKSNNASMLVFGRVVQGVGAALLIPASAAIITTTIDIYERGKMMGIYIAVASLFLAVGPIIGGLLTEFIGWRWIFWLNLPIILFSLAAVNKSTLAVCLQQTTLKRIDWFGAIWLSLSLVPMIVALLQSSAWGWSSLNFWSLIIISWVSLFLFINYEKKQAEPLLDLSLFKSTSVRVGIGIVIITQYSIISIAFWPTFFQEAFHFSAAQSGLGLIPVTLPIMIISPISGNLMDKYGPRYPATLGVISLILGAVWVGLSAWSHNYWLMLPGLFLFGSGPSFLLACMMTYLFSSVEPQKRGSIAGFATFFRQIGSTIGLALTGSILSNAYAFKLTAGQRVEYANSFAFMFSTFAIAALGMLIVYLLKFLPNTAMKEPFEQTTQTVSEEPAHVSE